MVMIKLDDNVEYSMDGYLNGLAKTTYDAVHNHYTSIFALIDGKSGKGKTTFSIQLAMCWNPKFTIDDLYYEPDKFLEGLANAKKGDVLIFDEAMLFSNRASLTKINRMMIQAMSMIRSKNIFIIFNINSIFDLDKNLVLSRADFLLHVYGKTLIDRGRFASFFKSSDDGLDRLKLLYLYGKKMYDYDRPSANFYGSFPKIFLIDEDEYERRKQIAVNKFLKSPSMDTPSMNRDKLIQKMLEVGIKQIQIAEVFDVSRQTIRNSTLKYQQNNIK